MAMSSHENPTPKSMNWFTPPEIISALGTFDLDPCNPDGGSPFHTAENYFTKSEDSLTKDWEGRVWLNPPYGREIPSFLEKLKKHGNGIALIFARTETRFFFDHVWNDAHAILFIKGRLHFYDIHGKRAKANAGAPSCLIAYGHLNAVSLLHANKEGKIKGKLIRLK